MTFTAPLSSEHPALSTAPVIPSVVQLHATELQAATPGSSALFFTSYPVSDNQSEAAAEAIRPANVMMEQMKTVHENSQAAYDTSAALRANVQVSRLFWLTLFCQDMLSETFSSIQSPVVCIESVHPLGVFLYLVFVFFHSVWASRI